MNPGWILLICVAVLGGLVWALSYFGLQIACRRNDLLLADLDKALTVSSYRDVKDLILEGRDWLEQQDIKEVSVLSYDGLRLAGELLLHENARGTILLFHGWHGSPVTDFGCSMKMYYDFGLNVLLVHERAHGKSEGKYITFGVRERHDVHSWIRWHNEHMGAASPLLLAGISMGASTVMMACGEPMPENVRGILTDCGFTTPHAIITSVVRSIHLPAKLIVPLLDVQAQLFAGFAFREYSTETALKEMKLPILFAHGEADTFVPCEMSKQNYAACASEDKTLLLVPDAAHGRSYVKQRERYVGLVAEFVNRVL